MVQQQIPPEANRQVNHGYLALGGNLGDTHLIFRIALRRLSALPTTQILQVACVYRTRAVGWRQPDFLNTVCAFSTKLSLESWMEEVEAIERALGKLPKPKEAPRPIDLDLLFWNDECRETGRWIVPHPRWHVRSFVVRPLLDLTPRIEIPLPQGKGKQTIELQPLLETISLESYPVRQVSW